MVVRYMPNSGHGGPPGTRVMTIVVFYVSAQIPNIEYFEVYGGFRPPGGISSFFSLNFPSNAVKNHVWGPIFVSSYDNFYKNSLLETQTHTQACGGGGGGGGGGGRGGGGSGGGRGGGDGGGAG